MTNSQPSPRSSFLSVDGLRLHVAAWGASETCAAPTHPPLLLLHGGMSHALWWEPLAPLLTAAARPFALDRRGHGDSDWTTPERYGWERDLADIEAVMPALDPGPWVVVGHSHGGLLAGEIAQRGGVPLAAIVLLDVPLHPTNPGLLRTGRSLAKVPQLRYSTLEEAVRGFKLFPPCHHVPCDVLEAIGRQSFKRTPEGDFTAKFHWQMLRRDPLRTVGAHTLSNFAARLARIAVPTLCVRGGESTILAPDEHAEMVARIARAEAVEIPGATHHLHVERPDLVAAAIIDFLRRRPST